MNVICKEVPVEHLVLGRWVKHIKKGKVYAKEEYNFGLFILLLISNLGLVERMS